MLEPINWMMEFIKWMIDHFVWIGLASPIAAIIVLFFFNTYRRERIKKKIWPSIRKQPPNNSELSKAQQEVCACLHENPDILAKIQEVMSLTPIDSEMLKKLQEVRDWIIEVRRDKEECLGAEIGDKRVEKWAHIATEVRLRKTLILAAANDLGLAMKDLKDKEYYVRLNNFEIGYKSAGIHTGVKDANAQPQREEGENDALRTVEPNVLVMAATDVFAEKAQKTLSDRANILIAIGIGVSIIALFFLLGGAAWIGTRSINELFFTPLSTQAQAPPSMQAQAQTPSSTQTQTQAKHLNDLEFPNHYLTLILIQKITVSGLLLGAIYFLVMIARALFHEAMVLYGRRHSLRFGRLYVYSKLGHVNYEDMEKAFAWNSEHRSAFSDIRGDKISKSLVQTIADVAKEVSKSTASAITEAVKAKNGPSS
jgi:hypothetical protein